MTEIKKKKKNVYRYLKSIKEITDNNVNILNTEKYMVDGSKYKHYKYQNKKYANDYKYDMPDYSFDNNDEDKDSKFSITEKKNIKSFSELYNNSNDVYKEINKLFI